MQSEPVSFMSNDARAWKSEWGVPIGGLLLIDTLAYQFIDGLGITKTESFVYYDFMNRDFFQIHGWAE